MCETQETDVNCKCTVKHACLIGEHCECKGFCATGVCLYDKIIQAGRTKICWLTFSPKPQTEAMRQFGACDYDRFKDLHKSYFKKNKYVKDYIIVSEINKKGLLHFHCMFSFTNKISIYKTIIQPLYYAGNVEPIFYQEPKLGLHYLFKDTLSMTTYFDGELPYFLSDKERGAFIKDI